MVNIYANIPQLHHCDLLCTFILISAIQSRRSRLLWKSKQQNTKKNTIRACAPSTTNRYCVVAIKNEAIIAHDVLSKTHFFLFVYKKKTWIKKFIYFILCFGVYSVECASNKHWAFDVWCECDTAWRGYV